jgi:hypothetical protein
MTRAELILLALFIVVAVFVASRAQSFGTTQNVGADGSGENKTGAAELPAIGHGEASPVTESVVPFTEAPSVSGRSAASPSSPAAVSEGSPSPATPKPTQRGDGGAVAGGTASFVDPSFGARYLALPQGPGHHVRICDRRMRRCVWRVSTDAGPSLQRQREGRIADVSFADFRFLCGGCDPWAKGLLRVVVVGP